MGSGCTGCREGEGFTRPISMAFQPIIDATDGTVFAYEALVRGISGEGAATILAEVDADNRYAFDQRCRVKAIELAAALDLPRDGASLSINFLPNAVYEPRACIRKTLSTALATGFPLDRIIFEFTENEEVEGDHLIGILRCYRAMGFRTAIDDFGAGHSGLALLTKFQPDIVKLDMELIRGIDSDPVKRTVVRHTLAMTAELGVTALCEGVETADEYAVLRDMGVRLMQGYLFAAPAFESLPSVRLPELRARAAA